MKISPVMTAALTMLLGGCASIVEGSSQSIAITTPPTEGAACALSNGRGNWQVMSPGAVTVGKDNEAMRVRCTKVGWQDAIETIPSDFAGWTLGNAIFGGLVGVGIDVASGAANKYPGAVEVPMQRAGGTPAAAATP